MIQYTRGDVIGLAQSLQRARNIVHTLGVHGVLDERMQAVLDVNIEAMINTLFHVEGANVVSFFATHISALEHFVLELCIVSRAVKNDDLAKLKTMRIYFSNVLRKGEAYLNQHAVASAHEVELHEHVATHSRKEYQKDEIMHVRASIHFLKAFELLYAKEKELFVNTFGQEYMHALEDVSQTIKYMTFVKFEVSIRKKKSELETWWGVQRQIDQLHAPLSPYYITERKIKCNGLLNGQKSESFHIERISSALRVLRLFRYMFRRFEPLLTDLYNKHTMGSPSPYLCQKAIEYLSYIKVEHIREYREQHEKSKSLNCDAKVQFHSTLEDVRFIHPH